MTTIPPRFTSDVARYLPGDVIAGRYRMMGLLGRGGTGDVYRADDLKLGQPVALKFLTRDFESDPERLDAFLREVRLSLRVTHPNVCRVYDVGQVESRHFLSMEYVDGEDLASLLRRIGRLPEDKAVQLARQMCEGLAAAHDGGVLHRDLKPANIMIDGRGRAKITDFGLAGATAGISGPEAQSGTPQYMAPEQFDGTDLTVQTDLYSLGLVLYELFTGKPAFEGRSLYQLAATRSSLPPNPSSYVPGLDPAIERAILRCVEPDPTRRPKSAERLAASLPGGDPLAMAVAAGETPSPDLVARSGGGGELRPSIAASALVTLLAGLGVVWYTEAGQSGIYNRVPLPKTPQELRVDARAALAAAGHIMRRAHSANGFGYEAAYLDDVAKTNASRNRWDHLATVRPAPIFFWYREAPRPLRPVSAYGDVGANNPPVLDPGFSYVALDPSGRLRLLLAIPASLASTPAPWAEPDWSRIFTLAGFDENEWTSVEPIWPPPRAADVRRAWTNGNLRIEANSFRGQVTWFRLIPPWVRQTALTHANATSIGESPVFFLMFALQALGVLGGVLIARRNLRQGRSDRRGAFRLATAYICISVAFELVRLDNPIGAGLEVFWNNLAKEAYLGLLVWVFYLAVEPYVRRVWPNSLIAWSRVLEGRFRDPLVGSHILLGGLAGLLLTLLLAAPTLFFPMTINHLGVNSWMAWPSGPAYVGGLLVMLRDSLFFSVIFLLGLLLARVIFRRPWIAYGAIALLGAVLAGDAFGVSAAWVGALFFLLVVAVLTQLGFFAGVVTVVFVSSWDTLSLTANADAWFFPQSVLTMALFAALAIYGFWVSLGEQKLFKESVLD